MEFRKAAAETRALWAAGNEYLTKAQPWVHFKTDPVQAALGVRVGINLVRLCAIAAQPIIPDAAGKILSALGLEGAQDWPTGDAKTLLARLSRVGSFTPAEILFAKIEDDQVAEWAERFGGAE
jgi:methionyl-tRNA synthetase